MIRSGHKTHQFPLSYHESSLLPPGKTAGGQRWFGKLKQCQLPMCFVPGLWGRMGFDENLLVLGIWGHFKGRKQTLPTHMKQMHEMIEMYIISCWLLRQFLLVRFQWFLGVVFLLYFEASRDDWVDVLWARGFNHKNRRLDLYVAKVVRHACQTWLVK